MAEKKRNTKQKILEESMRLFSISGFDAVSIRTIADAVGIGNSALYKHFQSKQDILDAIVEYSIAYFTEKGCRQMAAIESIEDMKKACLSMYDFQTNDDWIVMFRRLLTLEQFKNPEMAKKYRTFFIELPIQTQATMFEKLMSEGIMEQQDAKVLAMELYAPFYMFHIVKATREERKWLEKHVELFNQNHLTNLS